MDHSEENECDSEPEGHHVPQAGHHCCCHVSVFWFNAFPIVLQPLADSFVNDLLCTMSVYRPFQECATIDLFTIISSIQTLSVHQYIYIVFIVF